MCKKGGTKLTEIDLISQQILTHEKEIENNIQVWLPALLTFGASVIIALYVALSTHVHRKLAGSLSMSVAGIALIIFTISTIDTNEIRNEITDFEKDYYYHKCEIPLREEVTKLQKDGLQ